MKISKKAQMEAFGLIFIVILLALGIFFMTYSSIKKQKESQSLSPSNIELGQNMIDAIKEIKLECLTDSNVKNIPLSDFIQDIAGENNNIYCNYTDSTTYFEKAVFNILNATLVKPEGGVPFYFALYKIDKKNNPYVYFNNLNFPKCAMDNNPTGDPGIQGYPLRNGGNAEMKLYICEMKYVENISTL